MGLEDTWGSGVASGVGYDLQGLSVKAISGLPEEPELALVVALGPCKARISVSKSSISLSPKLRSHSKYPHISLSI